MLLAIPRVLAPDQVLLARSWLAEERFVDGRLSAGAAARRVKANEEARRAEIWTTRVRMQIQRHAAGAFAVLALALLGIPLGLTASRSETFVNLALALGLALLYYLLLFLISLLENTPAVRPDLLLWVPNFLYEALGLTLLYRAAQR